MNIRLSDSFTYKKLIRFTLPSIVMMVFTSVYSVVDGLFVSNILGKTPFAAVNLVMPFTMMLAAIGFMIGTGGTALVSKKLGEGDEDTARRYFTLFVVFTLLLGLIVSAAAFVLMRPVCILMGATADMLEDCVIYGRVLAVFNSAFMLQVLFHSFCVAAERPNVGLFATIAAGLMNMLLDFLFIAVFKWGIAGAGAATGISQLVGAVIPMLYFTKKGRAQLWFTKTRLEVKPLLQACANGVSEFLSNIANSVSGMAYNLQLLRFAGEDGVAAYGVLMYVNFIFISIFIGYSVGSAPVIGFHYGAKNRLELKSLLAKSAVLIGAVGIVMTALALSLSRPLASVFVGYDDGLMALTRHAFVLFAFSFLFVGFNIFISAFFTALNNGLVSGAVSFLRTLVFQLLAVTLLPLLLGTDGIWLAAVAAELAALLSGAAFLIANRRKYGYM